MIGVFNELISLMLDLSDDQLEKVKAFILAKLKLAINPISNRNHTCPPLRKSAYRQKRQET